MLLAPAGVFGCSSVGISPQSANPQACMGKEGVGDRAQPTEVRYWGGLSKQTTALRWPYWGWRKHHCSGKDTHHHTLHPLTLQKPHAAEAEQAGAPLSESLACSSMLQHLETKTNKEMGWKLPKVWKHWTVLLSLGTLKSCANWCWNTLRLTAGKLVTVDVLYFFVEAVIWADTWELSHWCCSGSKGLPAIRPCSWPWGSEMVVWSPPGCLAQFRKSCSFPPGKRVFWVRVLEERSILRGESNHTPLEDGKNVCLK